MNAATALLPHALACAALWFAGTGLVLHAARGPRGGYGRALATAGLAGVAGLVAVAWSLTRTSTLAAYAGFAGAVAVWGWLELAFLTGAVTGPRRAPAAPAQGWPRFRAAAATLIHHEIAVAAVLLALLALSWNAPNPTGALAFALLFALRLSAKLNIHAGVPNPAADLLPPHMGYLASYFRRRAFGPALALSLGVIAAGAWAFAAAALAAQGGARAGLALLAALAALGLIEHLFLALPVRDAALWGWAIPGATSRKLTRRTTRATSVHAASSQI